MAYINVGVLSVGAIEIERLESGNFALRFPGPELLSIILTDADFRMLIADGSALLAAEPQKVAA